MPSFAHEAIFKGFKGLWTADSTLGINTSDQRVRDFIRRGESRLGPDGQQRQVTPPYIVMDFQHSQDDALGPTSSGPTVGTETVATMHVFTKQDTENTPDPASTSGQTPEDVISEAIIGVFHEKALASVSGWTFTKPVLLDSFRGPSDGERNHFIHRFMVIARQ